MDITNLLMQYLSSEETYQFTRDIKLRVLYGDPQHIKSVLQALSKFISDPKEQPILRLLALKFNKELTETFSEEYIYLMQKIVLPKLEIIAQFQRDSQDSQKGKLIFLQNVKPSQSNREIQSIGQEFYKTVLDCIWVWSKWFPLDQKQHVLSQYKVTMEKLLKIGIKFEKVEYFDFQIILKHMPLSIPPLPMIIQLRHLLRAQPNNSTKQLCDHLVRNSAFESYKSKYHTYGDMLHQIAMRSIMARVKGKRTGTLGLGDFILEEQNRKLRKQVSVQSSQDSKAYLQAILVEKQQAENMNSCYEQKNKELQKQIINLQNQTVLLQKEQEVKDNIILQITNQLNNVENKFANLFEKFQDKYPQNACTIAQFEKDMQKFRESYEIASFTVELKKLRADYNNLKSKHEELEFQFDNILKENESLLRINQQLEQKIMKFERKQLSKPTSNTQSFRELDRQDSIDSQYQINTAKSQVMLQQQQIVQLKAQIALLKDQILKGEKKTSQSSTFSITPDQHADFEICKEKMILEQYNEILILFKPKHLLSVGDENFNFSQLG